MYQYCYVLVWYVYFPIIYSHVLFLLHITYVFFITINWRAYYFDPRYAGFIEIQQLHLWPVPIHIYSILPKSKYNLKNKWILGDFLNFIHDILDHPSKISSSNSIFEIVRWWFPKGYSCTTYPYRISKYIWPSKYRNLKG